MNALYTPNTLQIGIDLGGLNHSVAISYGHGKIVNEFEIPHTQKAFESFHIKNISSFWSGKYKSLT